MTEYIGWIGTFLGFFSFALLALGKIKNTHWFFSGCILVSSIIFFYTSYLIQNYQSIFTNLFFIVSSFLALIGITLKARWLSKPILYGTCLFVFLLSSSYYIILNTNDWFMQSIGWVPVFSFPFIFCFIIIVWALWVIITKCQTIVTTSYFRELRYGSKQEDRRIFLSFWGI